MKIVGEGDQTPLLLLLGPVSGEVVLIISDGF